jgi:cytochrome oxidase Cu insertion factor (SCO1/SenC/PrrC family)
MRWLLLLPLIIALAAIIVMLSAPGEQPNVYLYKGRPKAPEINLRDQYGNYISFGGRYIVLTFSYTGCPDVGYLTVMRINQSLSLYAPGLLPSGKAEVWVVTVDADTDTPERALEYTKKLGLPFRWLVGNKSDLERVWSTYNITVKYDPVARYIAHDVRVYLIDPQGRLVARIDGVPKIEDLKFLYSLIT